MLARKDGAVAGDDGRNWQSPDVSDMKNRSDICLPTVSCVPPIEKTSPSCAPSVAVWSCTRSTKPPA